MGGYAYLDGELHVRVNLACDAIMQSVIANYGAKNTRLANLCTPTGVTFMCLHIISTYIPHVYAYRCNIYVCSHIFIGAYIMCTPAGVTFMCIYIYV